jgi:hypothetical protein
VSEGDFLVVDYPRKFYVPVNDLTGDMEVEAILISARQAKSFMRRTVYACVGGCFLVIGCLVGVVVNGRRRAVPEGR